jgi:hypothetical protein
VNHHRAAVVPDILCQPAQVPGLEYRLTVAGELSDSAGIAFEGMTLTRSDGQTVLAGPVRDQAELQGFLRRVSDLGLTLLSVVAIDEAERR